MVNEFTCTTTGAVPSSLAGFNDSKCEKSCVNSVDPLLFTCELSYVVLLRVSLPNEESDRESISSGYSLEDVKLPAGYVAVSLNISHIDFITRNISLELLITNASLLNGGEITCDDSSPTNIVMARCPVCGKFLT